MSGGLLRYKNLPAPRLDAASPCARKAGEMRLPRRRFCVSARRPRELSEQHQRDFSSRASQIVAHRGSRADFDDKIESVLLDPGGNPRSAKPGTWLGNLN